MTALDIITGAFETIGVYAPGQTLQPQDSTGGLRRLNLMMGQMSLQSYMAPVVSREVFSLTSDVGVYTIGPGGDFDTIRPTSVQGAAILLNSEGSPSSVTSLTSAAGVVTATMTNHGASDGQNVTIRGASPVDYNGTYTVTVTGVNTFTYLIDAATITTPATGTITAAFESTGATVVEVPRALLTDDAWQAIQIKQLTAPQFTDVYFNPTYNADLATINLWPIPNTSINSLVLYRQQQLTSFASLTASYYLPPGCEETLQYNLAKRLLVVYGITDEGTVSDVRDMATSTLYIFKRANVKLSDLATDPALIAWPGGGYNILTGSGGGSPG